MSVRPYSPDSKHEVILQQYEEDIPLAFNVIYYLESPENDALNSVMRQLADKAEPLFYDAEMQPQPFRLQYIAQSELKEENFRTRLSGVYDEEDVSEAINSLRLCLSDGKGGTLSARCLPMFSYKDVFENDHAVHTYTGFHLSSPQEAADNARWFAFETAKLNFYRLTGESYEHYLEIKRPSRRPSHNSYGGGRYLGFMVREKTPQEITDTRRKHAEELAQILEQYNYDNKEKTTILEIALQLQKAKGKLKDKQTLKIENNKIYLYLSEKQKQEIRFRRADIAKMLYIFFLIQIKRANKNHSQPKYISQTDLEHYKDELLSIYMKISRYSDADVNRIKSVWDKNYNDFGTALSSIRNSFRQVFDEDMVHRYSIEIRKKDTVYGSLYGIDLDVDDFDLDSFKYMV